MGGRPSVCSGLAKNSHLSPGFYLFIWLHWVLFVACGIFSAACKLLVVVCGIQFPHQGSNPCPLNWEHRLLVTGPPWKSFSPGLCFPSSCSHLLYLLLTCPECRVSCLPEWMLTKTYQSGWCCTFSDFLPHSNGTDRMREKSEFMNL